MGKFLWEGREKSLPSWLSQFSFALENAKKNLVFHFGVCRHTVGQDCQKCKETSNLDVERRKTA
jgi:hypothetical protein